MQIREQTARLSNFLKLDAQGISPVIVLVELVKLLDRKPLIPSIPYPALYYIYLLWIVYGL